MPAGPMTETSRARRSRPVAWKRSLSSRSSSSRPTNGASSASRAIAAATLGDDPQRRATPAPAPALPLSSCSPAGSKAIAAEAARIVDSPTRTAPGGSDRLESRGGVDEVAGDHALVRRADRHGRLAGQDAGAGLDASDPRPADGVDELEAGADGPLGVVLAGGRRAPDRHDRVADELLDGAAVAADDVAWRGRSSGSASRGRPRRRAPRRRA